MKKITPLILILLLLLSGPAFAVKEYAVRYAAGTAMEVYSPNNPPSGLGSGDFSSNTSTSVDGEIVLFSGTGGKTGKRATQTGMAKVTSGVLSAGTVGTDYGRPCPYSALNSTQTIGATACFVLGDTSGGAITLTLPTAASVGNKFFKIKRSGSSDLTIDTTSSQTIDGDLSVVLGVNNIEIDVFSDGSNWRIA